MFPDQQHNCKEDASWTKSAHIGVVEVRISGLRVSGVLHLSSCSC